MEESRREDNDGILIRDCYGQEYVQPLAFWNSKVQHECVEVKPCNYNIADHPDNPTKKYIQSCSVL